MKTSQRNLVASCRLHVLYVLGGPREAASLFSLPPLSAPSAPPPPVLMLLLLLLTMTLPMLLPLQGEGLESQLVQACCASAVPPPPLCALLPAAPCPVAAAFDEPNAPDEGAAGHQGGQAASRLGKRGRSSKQQRRRETGEAEAAAAAAAGFQSGPGEAHALLAAAGGGHGRAVLRLPFSSGARSSGGRMMISRWRMAEMPSR